MWGGKLQGLCCHMGGSSAVWIASCLRSHRRVVFCLSRQMASWCCLCSHGRKPHCLNNEMTSCLQSHSTICCLSRQMARSLWSPGRVLCYSSRQMARSLWSHSRVLSACARSGYQQCCSCKWCSLAWLGICGHTGGCYAIWAGKWQGLCGHIAECYAIQPGKWQGICGHTGGCYAIWAGKWQAVGGHIRGC